MAQGISPELLRWKGIEATTKIAESPNSKVIVIGGGKDGLPLILGGTNRQEPERNVEREAGSYYYSPCENRAHPAARNRRQELQRAFRDRGLTRAARDGATVVSFAELAFERFHPQRPAGDAPWRLAETVPGPTTDLFARLARDLGVVVVLNLFERDGDRTFDCSPVIDADGTLLGRTRMIHITDYPCFHEQGYYVPGDTGAPVYRTRAGLIGVAICYDRHFPEYMRALALAGAEVGLRPAGWSRRRMAGGSLRGGGARRGLPERLLRRALQSRRCRGVHDVRRRVVRLFAGWPRHRARGASASTILYADLRFEGGPAVTCATAVPASPPPELYADWLSKK